MSREIKFRGFRKDNNEWVTGNLHSIYQENVSLFKRNWYTGEMVETVLPSPLHCSWILRPNIPTEPGWDMSDTYMKHEVVFNSVGQYTGLKDKNGKEIYDGDVCRGFQKEQEDTEGKYGYWLNDTVVYTRGGFKLFSKCLQDAYTKEQNVIDRFMWHQPSHLNNRSLYCQINDIEIIGNIHQNPELL